MFRFDFQKAMQALGVLLREPGTDQGSYLKLIKLLYIAEKESLLETGHPITGDRMVAMEHGPVLSLTYDVIKGKDPRPGWAEHFRTADNYEIEPLRDPGHGQLCPYEVAKLREVSARHKDDNRWAMTDIVHQLPEWKKNNPGDSSRPIPLQDILASAGKGAMLREIRETAEAEEHFARAFGL